MSRQYGCKVQRIYEQFDNQDRAALMDLFLSDRTHIDLAREMTDAGHPMSEHTVRAHRKSDCSCNWVA